MKSTLTALILYLFIFTNAQYQFSNWALSENTGISFVTEPSFYFESSLNSGNRTSTATISDTQGNILFYTDGNTVYNQRNQVMENGTGLNTYWLQILDYPTF